MIPLILQGIGFGFAAGTSPGPLQSYLISTTLSQGWRGGIVVIFSPLLTDIPIIILMTFILSQLPDLLQRGLQFAGGVFVLILAWRMFQAWQANTLIEIDAPDTSERQRTLSQAMVMNVLSPGPYIFWGSVTGPLLRDALAQSTTHVIGFMAAFYGTFLGISALWVIVFDRLRQVDPAVTQAILTLTVIVLAVLGLGLIVQGLGLVN